MKRKWSGSKWIRRERRLAIYLRDGMACAYCGQAVEDGAKLSLDHLQPVSMGGKNATKNLVTCCQLCNSVRGNRDTAVFATAVAKYLDHSITGDMIMEHIARCIARPLPTAEAKRLIAQRGSAAKIAEKNQE